MATSMRPGVVPRLRAIKLFAPIHIRHRFLNGIGHVCKAADAIFGTKLHARLKTARAVAVVDLPSDNKRPWGLRRVWEEFRHDEAESSQI